MSQTTSEKKVSNLIHSLFSAQMNDKVKNSLENIKIRMVQESEEETQAAMIIIMPIKVLDIIHQNFTLFRKNLANIFKNYNVFCVREPLYNKLSKSINKNVQEQWIFDLCYPAEVQCRMTEIKDGGKVLIEKVMLERKCDFLQEDFKIMENAYRTLTDKTVIYALRHY
ncbi:40S ribosomal protein S7 [Trachipleistophora hominis]|uniref:40S ribosomal protein S7 n=1 Tax=Trachipleistophora hominis TaxID=72359 RepID=L7JW77_TRAHO|nr:40S ribosomal protein S7 [Trachipleistophora hominis]